MIDWDFESLRAYIPEGHKPLIDYLIGTAGDETYGVTEVYPYATLRNDRPVLIATMVFPTLMQAVKWAINHEVADRVKFIYPRTEIPGQADIQLTVDDVVIGRMLDRMARLEEQNDSGSGNANVG